MSDLNNGRMYRFSVRHRTKPLLSQGFPELKHWAGRIWMRLEKNVADSPALSRARDLQAMQRVSLMVEGQKERRWLKKREIGLFSSIVTGEAHTDCCGIAVIFKVAHTNLCSGGATCKLPSGGESFATSKFFHTYLSFFLISTLSKPHIHYHLLGNTLSKPHFHYSLQRYYN